MEKMLEEDVDDVSHTEGALEMISKSVKGYITEKVDSDSKVMNNNFCFQENCVKNAEDYINDTELNFQFQSDDKCSCCLQMSSEEHNLQNFSPDLPLTCHESLLIGNEPNSSSLSNSGCSDFLLLKKIDKLLQSETSPFNLEITDFIQDLLLEMKALLNNVKNVMNSSTDPVSLSYITRCQIIRQYLEKILFMEFKKVEECKIEKQNFEEYTFCMKSSALKQDKLIHSLLEQVNSCVNENRNLHKRLCFLKDKLQSFGLLKPQAESNAEFKSDFELLIQISDTVDKISEDNINLGFQPNNAISNNYLEFLQIFKTSSDNLQTLSIQAKNLQLLSDSSHKLNDNLISRIQDQESHMKGITRQLEKAHNILAAMKKQHQRLQSAENIVKYDLQEKRKFLNKLKQQLEATRENCDLVRIKNSKSEAEWQDLRREFVQRNKQISEESDFIDDRGEESGFNCDISEENDLVDDKNEDDCFANQCMTDENCFVDNKVCKNAPDNEISINNSDIESKYELKRIRLQMLEEQCKLLYTNLKNSSNKGKELDSRLESWCKSIENSRHKASKNNNLSLILNADKEYENLDQAASEKINTDFISDVDSSLSSPEIGSFDSDSCSCIPHNSSATSNELFSLESLKTDELSMKIDTLDSNKLPLGSEKQQSLDSDPMQEAFYDICNSKTTESVQDNSCFESVESLGESENCQAENFDSKEIISEIKASELISSTKNKRD